MPPIFTPHSSGGSYCSAHAQPQRWVTSRIFSADRAGLLCHQARTISGKR